MSLCNFFCVSVICPVITERESRKSMGKKEAVFWMKVMDGRIGYRGGVSVLDIAYFVHGSF